MANTINWGKIYSTSYWGTGINNAISWGKSYLDLATSLVDPDLINYFYLNTGAGFTDGFYSNEIDNLLSNESAFTIEFEYQIVTFAPNKYIFQLEASPSNRIGILNNASDTGDVYLRLGDGTTHNQQRFRTAVDSNYASGSSAGHHLTAVDGNWHHIALTFDTGVVKFYVDGLEVTGDGGANVYPTSLGNLSGATFRLGWFGNVNLDEIRVKKGVALIPNPVPQTNTDFDVYFNFSGNEKPTFTDSNDSAVATANTGSDSSVTGFILGASKTAAE